MFVFNASRLSYLHLLLAWVTICSAGDDADNHFNSPGSAGPTNNFESNLQWAVGSYQTVDFTTTANSWNIRLFQQVQDGSAHGRADFIQNITYGTTVGHTSFNWQVQAYGADLGSSPVFFFWGSPQNSGTSWTSHYFNITTAPVSTSATAPATTTTTTTPAPSSASSSLSPTTSTSSASLSSMPSSTTSTFSTSNASVSTSIVTSVVSSGTSAIATVFITPTVAQVTNTPATEDKAVVTNDNSTSMKVGLGVGLGVGIPALALAGLIFFIKRRAATKSTPAPARGVELYASKIGSIVGAPPAWMGVYEVSEREAGELAPENYPERGPVELPGQYQWSQHETRHSRA